MPDTDPKKPAPIDPGYARWEMGCTIFAAAVLVLAILLIAYMARGY